MSAVEELRSAIPETAKDIKLNLQSVLQPGALTPAQRWGVATDDPQILLCGSGARRGGAVSAIGGHNAAMAVLENTPG